MGTSSGSKTAIGHGYSASTATDKHLHLYRPPARALVLDIHVVSGAGRATRPGRLKASSGSEEVRVNTSIRIAAALALAVLAACGSSTEPAKIAAVPAASPKAVCGPGSRPELGLQGRVSRAEHDSG